MSEIEIEIPPDATSFFLQITGDAEALYALADLVSPSGERLTAFPEDVAVSDYLASNYYEEENGRVPGMVQQTIRLGIFTLMLPNTPDIPYETGRYRFTVGSDMPDHTVSASLLVKRARGNVGYLPIHLFAVSDTFSYEGETNDTLDFLPDLNEIYTQAGITVHLLSLHDLPDSPYQEITDFVEPQENPETQSARLAASTAGIVTEAGISVYVVESLPSGVGGLSLGTPGTPYNGTYYTGVVVRRLDDSAEMARVVAHEIGHYLGLYHVDDVVVEDPIADTEGFRNLMERGTELTPGQRFVMQKHPLVRLVEDAQAEVAGW